MAITATSSNHAKYMMATKKIDLATDTLKAILMNTSFTFDPDTHATRADVTSAQLATNYGYTQDNKTLTTVVVTEDDTTNKATLTCDNVTWTASGGDIGPFRSMIIYDDTTTDDTVITCIDFGTNYTIINAASFTAQTIKISLV